MKYFTVFLAALAIFSTVSIIYFEHSTIESDAISYIDAMHTMTGSPLPAGDIEVNFAMHRILTTFLGLESILILSLIFGKLTTSWLIFDVIMYFLVNIFFYKLLLKMFKSDKTALVGGLLFASNYAMITAGLGYFMDIGGWTFYVLSIYFLYTYIESGQKRDIILTALCLAVGGLFKENALFAYIPMFFVVLYENLYSPWVFIKKITPLTLIAFTPMVIHHIDVFIVFDHGYLYWVRLNQEVYHYSSRFIEYVKSFGSLLNFLIPLSGLGLLILLKSIKHRLLDTKNIVFIASVLASSVPAILWPGITQRVLFMVVPWLIIFACFFVRRYERYWYAFIPIMIVYVLTNFFMDSFIFGFINLPFK